MPGAPPQSMQQVADEVRTLDPDRSVDDVLDRLDDIQRAVGPATTKHGRPVDGVACFNYMYRSVTKAVHEDLNGFTEPDVVGRLAVVFAEFYINAYDAATAGTWISKAWEPLFEDRRTPGIAPIQFALAGINAHINNDLPWALLQTWDELGVEPSDDSAAFLDFQSIDGVLHSVAREVRTTLESGFLRWLDRLFGRFDDLFESFVIARAREDAWRRAVRWRVHLDDGAASAHERHVGFESHLILAA
jgi:hypothetical protein